MSVLFKVNKPVHWSQCLVATCMADEETSFLPQILGGDGVSTRGWEWESAPPGPHTTRDELHDINNLVNAVGVGDPVTTPAPTRPCRG